MEKKISGASASPIGCGNIINWNEMPQVQLPIDLQQAPIVSTDDIKMLPESFPGVYDWISSLYEKLAYALSRITLD